MRGILLEKAYGASVMIGAAVLLVSLRFDSFAISAGVVTGTALAMAVLASWQWIARRALTPDSPSRNLALALGMLKLPLLGAVVYVLVGREWDGRGDRVHNLSSDGDGGMQVRRSRVTLLLGGCAGQPGDGREFVRESHTAPRP